MAVAPGYPEAYPKGMAISGLQDSGEAMIFHAGTKHDPTTKKVVTHGGRVLGITAFGDNLQEAIDNTYREAGKIHFEGIYYRSDIGKDLLAY
jgi:phosphoribosylamine--glycine ligase